MTTNRAEWQREYRARNPEVRERNRRLDIVRNRAIKRLMEEFPVEYQIFLMEEKRKEGL